MVAAGAELAAPAPKREAASADAVGNAKGNPWEVPSMKVALKVPTPLRRRVPLEARPPPPSPAPRFPGQPPLSPPVAVQQCGAALASSTRANAARLDAKDDENGVVLSKGDRVTVAREFVSKSFIAVKILKGWQGRVVKLESSGDALINFGEQGQLLWVAHRHCRDLVHAEAPVAATEWPPAGFVEEVAMAALEASTEGKAAVPALPRTKKSKGHPVWVHVYDLGQVSRLVLNSWAVQGGGPGGAFHCGLEVLGVEFSFQAISSCQEEDNTTGVTWHYPKSHPRHVYRESIWLGFSPLKVSEIGSVLEHLELTWLARDYHCLRNNCTDFAEQLALELRSPRPFPRWVHGVAKSPFLKAAGGCCSPTVSKTSCVHMLAPCCSSWGSVGSTASTERSCFAGATGLEDSEEADSTLGI
uniref:PPPDE domain-containing protein n=1 Tax=Alexandrium catenella TaxID=2925 RepID=A0A7S1L4S3_ALECA